RAFHVTGVQTCALPILSIYFSSFTMQKIILVGYMGSGKTTIGKNLSLLTGLPFVDLDTYIEEKENLSIQEIFKTKGEIYFRKQRSEESRVGKECSCCVV